MTGDVRDTLFRLAGERGESLAALSRMLRRNDAYLQQFVTRGTPRRLGEADRRLLADHFGVDEALLGAPPAAASIIEVPFLAARAAAGRGIVAEDRLIRTEPIAARLLREAGVSPAGASMIRAEGDSMAPTILSGDRLLVDRTDRAVRARAIYVLRRADELSVKRVLKAAGAATLISDNPAFPPVTLKAGDVEIVGAVKLLLRDVR